MWFSADAGSGVKAASVVLTFPHQPDQLLMTRKRQRLKSVGLKDDLPCAPLTPAHALLGFNTTAPPSGHKRYFNNPKPPKLKVLGVHV